MGGFILAGSITVAGYAAEAAEPPVGGDTTVRLDASFVGALESLKVTPGVVGGARLYEYQGGVYAAFPITTGSVDLSKTLAEINHSGGLSLVAGTTRVQLLDFAIEVNPKGSILTGVVTVNGVFVGRIPLFDLSLAKASVWTSNNFLDINGVTLTLDAEAAEALSETFHTSIPEIAVGTAEVRTVLAGDRGL
jgi:hypothetical protein